MIYQTTRNSPVCTLEFYARDVGEGFVSAEKRTGAPLERYFIDVTQGVFDNFRLLIQRPNSAGVFSGDFNGGKTEADPLSALQRTFAGSIIPLEVFSVNASPLSPQALCQYLQKFNPGRYTTPSLGDICRGCPF